MKDLCLDWVDYEFVKIKNRTFCVVHLYDCSKPDVVPLLANLSGLNLNEYSIKDVQPEGWGYVCLLERLNAVS